ncbi:MAG: phytanoyl-CoA dioxygenase family protein [Phycisphaera sp.]|nr:phytanoyl-CoA dioxygenase family protein [Phycisphaera sp.]
MTARLTPQHVEKFNAEGFLLPGVDVFKPGKFEALKTYFDELLDEWSTTGRSRSPEHMDVPHFWHPRLFDWLLDDEVLDLVEPILGPDIALFSSHFICKPPAIGKRVPWHEDSAYWKGRLDPMRVVTVWLAVDPSTPENGCMRVIPGTHLNGFSDYDPVANPKEQVFGSEIRQGQYDESKAVDCVLKAGQASLHDGRIIHGSAANKGTMRRCGYTMRYISAATKHMPFPNSQFEIYLARGRDRAGNTYGDPTGPNAGWIAKHQDGQPAGH